MIRRHVPNGIYCSLCDQHHSAETPVHRLPIQRLLAKQTKLEEQIRRLKATLARMQVVWDAAERLVDAEDQDTAVFAMDTIREAVRHG